MDPVAYIIDMEHRSKPLLQALGGQQQALEIAVNGLMQDETKSSIKKMMKLGQVRTFDECLNAMVDLRDRKSVV